MIDVIKILLLVFLGENLLAQIVKENYTDSNGLRQGTWIVMNSKGVIEQKLNYFNNKMDGQNLFFWGNGILRTKMIYQNGLPWTLIECNDSLNNKLDCGTLLNGNGTWIEYTSSGNKKWLNTYIDGYMNGLVLGFYAHNGQLEAEGVMIDFKIPETVFDTVILDGVSYLVMQTLPPQRIGLWKYYNYDGANLRDEIYNDKGKLIETLTSH